MKNKFNKNKQKAKVILLGYIKNKAWVIFLYFILQVNISFENAFKHTAFFKQISIPNRSYLHTPNKKCECTNMYVY